MTGISSVDIRVLGAQILSAVGCWSEAEGKHAEARPINAVDHGDIGSLSSVRQADEYQTG